MYLHSEAGKTNFFDCRLDFLIPSTVGTGTLVVTKDTVAGNSDDGDTPALGCGGATTLQQYLDNNSGAVLGAGDSSQGSIYSFVLSTGSTNQNNNGLEVCWSNVAITTNTETTNFEFSELPSQPPSSSPSKTPSVSVSIFCVYSLHLLI